MAYTDSDAVSNFLQRSLSAYETNNLSDLIATVQEWLDRRLNSTFDQVSETTRYYDGGVKNLDIDPCTAISEVKTVDDSGTDSNIYTDTTDYVAEPVNETVKRQLRKRYYPFPRGTRRIAVTAKFSEYDSGVPTDIKILTTRLVAALINQGKQANIAGTGVKSESLEGHSISYFTGGQDTSSSIEGIAESDPTVKSILAGRDEILIDNVVDEGQEDNEGGLFI